MQLKKILSHWQTGLDGKAWNSLFWDNHDQPRAASRWGDDSPLSAKMLATCLLSLQGTPYIYEGDELGMTNAYFKDLSQYRDIESLNAFKELTGAGLISADEMMECLALRSRDNARTPVQWDDSPNAGFTSIIPNDKPQWLLNVQAVVSDVLDDVELQGSERDFRNLKSFIDAKIQAERERGTLFRSAVTTEVRTDEGKTVVHIYRNHSLVQTYYIE